MAIQTEATISLPIEQLRDCNLLGKFNRGIVFPVTVTHAIKSLDFDGKPIEGVDCCLEDRLQKIEKALGIGGSSSEEGCSCTAITIEEIESLIGNTSSGGDSDENETGECGCSAISEEAIESLLD